MGNGHGGARLHEPFERILHQTFALGVECRCGLVEDEDGRVLEDGTRNAHTLALSARQTSAAVADVGVVTVLALHNKLVGVGNACRLLHLLLCGVVHAKGYVSDERVVEQDGLLVHVAYELPEVVYAEVFDVYAVDEHLALLHVIIARNEVDECRLAAAALSHQRNGLALWNDEVDVAQHPLLAVAERHMAKLDLVLERADVLGVGRLLYGVLCLEDLVDALHRCEALGYVVACLGEVFERVDDRVEHHEIIDERRSRQDLLVEHQDAAHPQHDDDEHRA